MNKQYGKHLCIITILLAGYAILSQYVYEMSGIFIHRAMVWNVFLALLPLLFMYLFLSVYQRKKYIVSAIFLIAWLLLFPNVPYLMSDFIHISPLAFYEISEQGTYYIRELKPWLELMHIALGVWFGMLVGYRSLYCFQEWMQQKYGVWYSWIMVISVSLLSGYGVFLGRFLRLNSWDILHPTALLKNIMDSMDSFAFLFTIFCSGFILITYAIFYGCLRGRKKSDENIICK